MSETVIEKMSAECVRGRRTGKPLILVETDDVRLVMDITLYCCREHDLFQLVAKKEKQGLTGTLNGLYSKLLQEDDRELQTYANLFTDWGDFMVTSRNPERKTGVYLLPLHEAAQDRPYPEYVEALRSFVKAYALDRRPYSRDQSSLVILYGRSGLLPEDLKSDTMVVEECYPDHREIKDLIFEFVNGGNTPVLAGSQVTLLADELAGFSRRGVIGQLQGLLIAPSSGGVPLITDPEKRRKEILKSKKQVLESGQVLELCIPKDRNEPKNKDPNRSFLAGMDLFDKWVEEKKVAIDNPEALTRGSGAEPPKGILLCGVPGCGKSFAAKALQLAWDKPMVKMSISKLMGGLVGQSERNLRIALRQAEAMAPCIVWIDELEKGFSGAGSPHKSSETSERMFGDLLDWMQNRESPCFIYATSNDITQLPSEFFRSGRFDLLFGAYMPTFAECVQLFRASMYQAERRRPDADGDSCVPLFDKWCDDETLLIAVMKALASRQVRSFVTGADISSIVNNALHHVKSAGEGKTIAAEDWKEALIQTVSDSENNKSVDVFRAYGSGAQNLNRIAACYLRMLREDFKSVSGRSLFDRAHFYPEGNAPQNGPDSWQYYDKSQAPAEDKDSSSYDRELFLAIGSRMEKLAKRMDEAQIQKLSGAY